MFLRDMHICKANRVSFKDNDHLQQPITGKMSENVEKI